MATTYNTNANVQDALRNHLADFHYGSGGNRGIDSVASAAALSLAGVSDTILLTGSTAVTSITGGVAGQRVLIISAGAITITNGNNIKIKADVVLAADDTIELVCNGTNWYGVSNRDNTA